MIYHSTRGGSQAVSSKEAILKGLCNDGGLFVSDELGNKKIDIADILSLSYKETAKRIFSLLLCDYSPSEISEAVENAYTDTFSSESVAPLTEIGDDFLLELYHGPTCAFKDIALCMLPQLMSKALSGSGKKIMIVTATSGDTGKAALSGFKDVPGIGILVFYPSRKVSDIQYLQMTSQEGSNVAVCGINGNFDDTQSAVKDIFSSDINEKLREKNIYLSSANSINIGRLVPQTVYYFESYRELCGKNVISPGEPVDFCVPTGNFGDVLAGYYAKLLGLPIGRLTVASNENNVLTDFLSTGVYDRNRSFKKTISPSMDILISSNLERMLYYMSGNDAEFTKSLMRKLKENGRYKISGRLLQNIREIFDAGCASDIETAAAIKEAYEKTGRLIDPHTAVGYKVMKEHKRKGVPCVLLSTASPYKFSKDVYEAVSGGKPRFDTVPDSFGYMEVLYKKTGVTPPAPLRELSGKPILHRDVIEKSEMKDYTLRKAGEILG